MHVHDVIDDDVYVYVRVRVRTCACCDSQYVSNVIANTHFYMNVQ